MVEKGHYFYVLHCADDTLYAGYAVNYLQRLATHNAGKGAKYTRLAKRRPAKLLYVRLFESKSEALKEEVAFKKLTRTQKIMYLSQQSAQNELIQMKGDLDAVSKKFSRS